MRNNFDGLRLLGALLVIVSHQFPLSGRAEPSFLTTLGGVGVSIFFGMSGYLVAQSWRADPCAPRFVARRLLRLWPALAVFCTTVWAVSAWYPFADAHDRLFYPLSGSMFPRNAFFVFGYWDGHFFPSLPYEGAGGTLWTIPIEAGCYAAVLFTGALTGQHWRLLPGILLPILAFKADGPEMVLPLLFCAGCAMRVGGKLGLVAAFACCLLLGRGWAALELGIAVGAVMVGQRSWAGLRSAGRFGDLSYGLYLWGWPAQQLGLLWLGLAAPFLGVLSWSLVVAGSIAWLSWHLIEKPALRLKPRSSQHLKLAGDAKIVESLGDHPVTVINAPLDRPNPGRLDESPPLRFAWALCQRLALASPTCLRRLPKLFRSLRPPQH